MVEDSQQAEAKVPSLNKGSLPAAFPQTRLISLCSLKILVSKD